ncbi:dolichol kinase [Marasmius crinis-equi]|uniref:dolichol kinase n=1 Tax=Marasmius crinis-equi TaxID=585013 RepID=A0ABR3FRB2_9AGAR
MCYLTWLEAAIGSLFYQFTLYVAVRLAHRSFTLGELGVVGYGGTALFMEMVNITRARIWPQTTPYIKTFRLPTPLLTFQISLVAGSFLTGFLLSPFLVLSRHIAQRPIRRLRYPKQKLHYRRRLALGFYVGAFIIVVGVIGMWARWCLNKRDPWLWAIFWLLEGRKKWSRPALLVYWGLLGSLSVAGWNRQLARSRRFRTRNPTSENLIVPGVTSSAVDYSAQGTGSGSENTTPAGVGPATPGATLGLTFPNLPSGAAVATDWLDAADKHVPTLKLNARRKFFHALAVVMFVPGVAFDPAFTHLCFSAAFSLFTFAEYVRYFAIYPFGASVHLFMNEFLDQKDSGTTILSHFYLLTGCAGSLWLENGSSLVEFSGILVLGVGDSLASIVGKRIGIHRWSPTSSKTLEGSLAFTLSIVLSAWILYLFGMVDAFSGWLYSQGFQGR